MCQVSILGKRIAKYQNKKIIIGYLKKYELMRSDKKKKIPGIKSKHNILFSTHTPTFYFVANVPGYKLISYRSCLWVIIEKMFKL